MLTREEAGRQLALSQNNEVWSGLVLVVFGMANIVLAALKIAVLFELTEFASALLILFCLHNLHLDYKVGFMIHGNTWGTSHRIVAVLMMLASLMAATAAFWTSLTDATVLWVTIAHVAMALTVFVILATSNG